MDFLKRWIWPALVTLILVIGGTGAARLMPSDSGSALDATAETASSPSPSPSGGNGEQLPAALDGVEIPKFARYMGGSSWTVDTRAGDPAEVEAFLELLQGMREDSQVTLQGIETVSPERRRAEDAAAAAAVRSEIASAQIGQTRSLQTCLDAVIADQASAVVCPTVSWVADLRGASPELRLSHALKAVSKKGANVKVALREGVATVDFASPADWAAVHERDANIRFDGVDTIAVALLGSPIVNEARFTVSGSCAVFEELQMHDYDPTLACSSSYTKEWAYANIEGLR